jgi:hypothetical protein
MINIKEIIDAWFVSFNPTQNQLNKSIERGGVCEICPSRKVITKKLKLATVCGECGCPIAKKIFSLEHNPCPLLKWEEIDKKYTIDQKTIKTFI